MNGTEFVPNRLEEDLLDVYRLMPSQDNERLLAHIAWMEEELKRVRSLQNQTERELDRISSLLDLEQ